MWTKETVQKAHEQTDDSYFSHGAVVTDAWGGDYVTEYTINDFEDSYETLEQAKNFYFNHYNYNDFSDAGTDVFIQIYDKDFNLIFEY